MSIIRRTRMTLASRPQSERLKRPWKSKAPWLALVAASVCTAAAFGTAGSEALHVTMSRSAGLALAHGATPTAYDSFVATPLGGAGSTRLVPAVLLAAAEPLDPATKCHPSIVPTTLDHMAELLRIDGRCLTVDFMTADAQSTREVRAEVLASEPPTHTMDAPSVGNRIGAHEASHPAQATQSAYEMDEYDDGDTWYLERLDAEKLWRPHGWSHEWRFDWPSLRRLVGLPIIRVPGWLKEEVIVAVIDSGTIEHVDLRGKLAGSGGDEQFAWFDKPCHHTVKWIHGTAVASLIASEQGNGRGIAGIAPRAKLLPIHIPGEKINLSPHVPPDVDDEACGAPSGGELTYATAVTMATRRGADVINLSQDTGVTIWPRKERYTGPLGKLLKLIVGTDDMFQIAIYLAQEQGVIVVAAVGNCGKTSIGCVLVDELIFPAAYKGVIGVGAIDHNGKQWEYSSSNETVDILAPGVDIATIVGGNALAAEREHKSGTSMAAPLVSGVIAHMLGRYPRASSEDVTEALYSTAEPLGGLPNTYPDSSGKTHQYGWGVIKPAAAIEKLGYLMKEKAAEQSSDASATVPEVTLTVGDDAKDWVDIRTKRKCESDYCKHLKITLQGFNVGEHAVECWSSLDDKPWYKDSWNWPGSSLWEKGGCWFGFPKERVWVTVDGYKSNIVVW